MTVSASVHIHRRTKNGEKRATAMVLFGGNRYNSGPNGPIWIKGGYIRPVVVALRATMRPKWADLDQRRIHTGATKSTWRKEPAQPTMQELHQKYFLSGSSLAAGCSRQRNPGKTCVKY